MLPVLSVLEGEHSDSPIDQTPSGYVRKVTNFIPRTVGAPARARGGWGYASKDLNSVSACSYIQNVLYAPFFSGPQIAMLANNLKLFKMASITGLGGTLVTTLNGLAADQLGKLDIIWHPYSGAADGGWVVIGAGDPQVIPNQTKVRYWDGGGAIADLTVTPPSGRRLASWGDYLIIGEQPDVAIHRAWFSAPGDPTSWDLAAGFITLPEEIVGIVPMGNMIFFLGKTAVHISSGDTPPSSTNSGNLSLKRYAFRQGCTDINGYTTYKDSVIWANGNGVFKSDGSSITDLTQQGGIAAHWRWLYSPSASDRIALSVYGQYLFCSITTSAQAAKQTAIFDLEHGTWWEWGNIPALSFACLPDVPSLSFSDDVLVADSAGPRVLKLAQCFQPTGAADADTTVVTASLLTGGLRFGSMGNKRFRKVFFTYSFQGGGTLTASYAPDINNGQGDPAQDPTLVSLGTVGGGTLNKTLRATLYVSKMLEAIQFKVSGSGDFRLHGIEVEVDRLDPVRDGDSRA